MPTISLYKNNNGLFEPELCSLAAELQLRRIKTQREGKKGEHIVFTDLRVPQSMIGSPRGIMPLTHSVNCLII